MHQRFESQETQVMVRREDEQAFAEMNGAKVKFVEDAARLVYERLEEESRIIDFRVICSPSNRCTRMMRWPCFAVV